MVSLCHLKKVSENYLKNWDTFPIFKNKIFIFKNRWVKKISKTKSRLKIDCSKYKRTDSEPLEIC